jgi:hypothetical protein
MNKQMSKEQLLQLIKELKKDSGNFLGIMSEFGLAGIGATAAGTSAAILGSSVASIPIVTALTGFGLVVAAPFSLIAGATVAGGLATYGLVKLVKGSGFNQGKKEELLRTYENLLKELLRKETKVRTTNEEKSKFIVSLKDPISLDLILPEDAELLIKAIQNGDMSIEEGYKHISNIIRNTPIS